MNDVIHGFVIGVLAILTIPAAILVFILIFRALDWLRLGGGRDE